MNDDILIRLVDVTRSHEKDGVRSLGVNNISFEVKKGDIVALIGPSGCGKTTILRMIANIIEPDFGSIRYNDQPIEHARCQGLIGYVPQSSSLVPFKTVIENIRMPQEFKKNYNKEKLDELVSLCQLNGYENYFPSQLSGGMKQRVAIARALSINPKILLLDEPFASLDEMIKEKLNEEVLKIQSKLNTTIVYVTHNIEEAVFLANKVIVLSTKPASIVECLNINLPNNRNLALRSSESFFKETLRVRDILKKI